jgi:hypothetical protein
MLVGTHATEPGTGAIARARMPNISFEARFRELVMAMQSRRRQIDMPLWRRSVK